MFFLFWRRCVWIVLNLDSELFYLEGKMNTNPIARKNDLVVQETSEELLVYDLNTSRAHCLNSSAALIWKSCDGSNSVTDIVGKFKSNGVGNVTEDFVWLAIDQLYESDLLENKVIARFNKHTRREALKTIGLASVVALPVIASLAAPERALGALSCACIPGGAECTNRFNCPAQTCNANGVCAP
jgi:hypothetical protein